MQRFKYPTQLPPYLSSSALMTFHVSMNGMRMLQVVGRRSDSGYSIEWEVVLHIGLAVASHEEFL